MPHALIWRVQRWQALIIILIFMFQYMLAEMPLKRFQAHHHSGK
jgi:hypothetical protein